MKKFEPRFQVGQEVVPFESMFAVPRYQIGKLARVVKIDKRSRRYLLEFPNEERSWSQEQYLCLPGEVESRQQAYQEAQRRKWEAFSMPSPITQHG